MLSPAVKLESISFEEYAKDVLPDTHALWGTSMTFDRYVAGTRATATSAYGRRRSFTVGLRENGAIVSSCKNYDRELRYGERTLRATGIGAVYTPERARGRGFASVMLGAVLDAERAAGRDLAFLYSDIHPAFYERLGFVALPSRLITLRANLLDGSPAGAIPLEDRDRAALRQCFAAHESARPWSLHRTPLVWDWMMRRWDAPGNDASQPVRLVVKRGRAVIAYAMGRRVLRADTFVVDECAFDGEAGRAVLPALLRAGAGDFRRVGGWLPPEPVRSLLPRGSVRRRKDAILMIVPISAAAKAWWTDVAAETLGGRGDPTWSNDHI